jgi:hypothetical protein
VLEDNCYFFGAADGRCKEKRGPISHFCKRHQNPFSDLDNKSLLQKTAEAITETLYVTEDKKISMHSPLTQKDVAALWTNGWNTLIERGYQPGELLQAIGSLLRSEGYFDELHKKLGTKWKKFEKIIAGIHLLQAQGAKVTFDDHVVGRRTNRKRQLDVSLRFNHSYYDYFVVVECKDYEGRVPIDELEAFRTKLEDVGAHKGIMVSSEGFQEGAEATARAYGIDLFTLTEHSSDWTQTIREQVLKVPFPRKIEFDHIPVPREGSPDHVAYEQIIFYRYDKNPPINLAKILTDVCTHFYDNNIAVPCLVDLKFPKEMFVQFPGQSFYTPVYGLKLHLENFVWKSSKTVDMPPQLLKYIYADTEKEKVFEIPADTVPIGIDTVLEPGKFYINQARMKYRCISIAGERATMMLMESRQDGHVYDVEFVMDMREASYYVPLMDEQEVERLEKRYQSLKKQNETPHARE